MISRCAAVLWILASLSSGPVLADPWACQKSAPAAAQKGVENAAKRQGTNPLNLATLAYCTDSRAAQISVDALPSPREDGSEDAAWLLCGSRVNRPRDWNCIVQRYQAIQVTPAAGQPSVTVQVYNGAIEATRERAVQAFALLSAAVRVEPCPQNFSPALSLESLRAVLARRYGPYRLYDEKDRFDLVRGGTHVRIRSATADQRASLECWDEEIIEE